MRLASTLLSVMSETSEEELKTENKMKVKIAGFSTTSSYSPKLQSALQMARFDKRQLCLHDKTIDIIYTTWSHTQLC